MKTKLLTLTLILTFLNGCASMARLNYNEQCAVQGMKLAGVSQGTGTAYGSTSGTVRASNNPYGNGLNYSDSTVVNTYSENVSCVVAEAPKDQCEVERWQQIAAPKVEYNSGYKTKYLVSGLGYWLFIVPGVFAKVVFDDELSKAEKKSAEIAASTKSCAERLPASKTQ